jgi:transcriptional regulator with XRE-family HTH domain
VSDDERYFRKEIFPWQAKRKFFMSIGERLREERERLGMTQPAFAAIAGTTKQTLFSWETGKTAPDASQLSALAASGVDVLYILTGITLEAHARLAAQQAAGEAARANGGEFRDGWASAEENAVVIQQAQKKDAKGFLAWTLLFLDLPKDKTRQLRFKEVGGALLEMLFFCIIASCGGILFLLAFLGGGFATTLDDFATCFSLAAAPLLAIALLWSSARPAFVLLSKRTREFLNG